MKAAIHSTCDACLLESSLRKAWEDGNSLNERSQFIIIMKGSSLILMRSNRNHLSDCICIDIDIL